MKNIVYRKKTSDGSEIIIRYPNKNDLRGMLDYINELSQERSFVLLQGEKMTLKQEKEYLEGILNKTRKHAIVYHLLFCDKKLIGISEIKMKNNAQGHIGIFGISIRKSARGKGLGKLLMTATLREAKKRLSKLKIIILGVFANNEIAIKLYKKLGFREYGLLPKGVRHRKKFVDEIFMWKKI